jgi:hypothetical protein
MVSATDRQLVAQLCSEVLAGEITLDAFYERRPSPGDPFLDQVLEDLEDAIQHTPSRLLRGGVDRPAWERSPERRLVVLDHALLGECGPEHGADALLRCRSAIDDAFEDPPTDDEIREGVRVCLAQRSGPA